MKKIKLVSMILGLCFIFVFTGFGSSAWATMRVAPLAQTRLLPDLIVSNIVLVKDCKIKVTIKNNGLGSVPETGYHNTKGAAVQMYKDGNPWGGIRLFGIDPMKKLKTPGASVSWIWFPGAANLNLVPGIHKISVTVDNNNAVKESKEKNNTRTVRLGCKGAGNQGRGDLSVRIQQCPVRVTAGQKLGSGFQVLAKSTFSTPVNGVVVDLILTSHAAYPVPAPFAGYSSNYSDRVLLKGGRENISFTGPGTVNVKLYGTNQIPVDTPPGVYYLGAVVDAGNQISEINESNNVSFCRITVVGK